MSTLSEGWSAVHVIATAGHVDHGKSTLVRALTGMEPDRWAEEQRRGMTIDLGFAWTTLPGDITVAFVDVPGHQRFISNMLAGVGPVPAVLFVVAADQGWSAQSTEHLQALDALGVEHGVLAITRSDLGDADLAEEEARDYLSSTALADMPAVAVSPVAGTGLDELRVALSAMTATLPERSGGRTRLWVDRVFSVRGAGTVVTGTLSSGAVSIGDELELHPSGERVRVRGIESLKEQRTSVHGVARVALNLRGIKASDVHRGDALTTPGEWLDVSVLDVRHGGDQDPPAHLNLHLGSAAVGVRVRPLGPDTARLTLDRAVPTVIGERGVLHDPGTHQVVSMTVLDPLPPPLIRRGAARRRADELAGIAGPDLAGELDRRQAVRRRDLVLAGVPLDGIDGLTTVVVAGDWLIHSARWRLWAERLVVIVDDWSRAHPVETGMPPAAAAAQLELPDPALLEAVARERDELVLDSGGLHRRGRVVTLPDEAEQGLQRILQRLQAHPFDAPELPDLADAGLTDKLLAVAVREGRLAKVSAGIYLEPPAIDEAVRRLAELEQPFTMAQARETLQTTRRVAIPLLEQLDRARRTVRVDSQLRQVAG